MARSKKTHYAIWSPSYGSKIVYSWEEAKLHIHGVPRVRHKGFYGRPDAERWLKGIRKRFETKKFYCGPLPDKVRWEYLQKLVDEQFNMMKELGWL
jgi:hypothetical protein